jgi:D-threo-aldose 1-dehydrogenase
VVAAGVFNSGILATDNPSSSSHYNYAPAPADVVDKAQKLARACKEAGYSLPQVAAQFPLLHPAIKVVCLGARNGEQALRNVGLFEKEIPREFYASLAESGLIDAEVLSY